MAQAIEENDPMMEMLTDALRAGPGSPQWHDAVAKVRADHPDADEFQLLLTARQHLESGKQYRAVRAGAGFSRKLFGQIEADLVRGSNLPVATVVAVLAGIVLVGLVIGIGFWLLPAGGPAKGQIEDLDRLLFVSPVMSVNIETPDAADPRWQHAGPLRLIWRDGLRPAPTGGATKDFVGGAIVSSVGLGGDQPVSFEVSIRQNRPSADLIAQVFVTDRPDFSQDLAVSSHELVWMIHDGNARVVLPGGRVDGKALKIEPGRQPITVRIAVNNTFATIDAGEKRLFAGPHGLSHEARYFGVRFLRRGNERNDAVSIQSIRVMKP